MKNIKLSVTYFTIILFFIASDGYSQVNIPIFGTQTIISGYESQTQGEVLPYFSSCPQFAKDALLTRCTDGKKIISWKTASLPEKLENEYYYFYCLAGHSSGTSSSDRTFDLKIDGVTYLTFKTPAKKSVPFTWHYTGIDSVSVVFEATKSDVHKDVFGNLYLRVPKRLIKPGKSSEISIVGHAENSNDWFMIFRYSYSEKVELTTTPLLVKTDKGTKQLLQIFIDHISPYEKMMKVKINNLIKDVPVHTGFNSIEIPIDTVNKPTTLFIDISSGSKLICQTKLYQRPVHRREVNIIHHSHNDIGYSHVQEEVVEIQYKNLLDALDMIEKTSEYPEGSRFVWNVETLWPIENFLKMASSSDIKRFQEAELNRRICISGFYAGVMTGLCSPEELSWIMEYAGILRKQYNFTIISAMFSDIPGMSWSMADAMEENGLKYLSNGPNYIETFPDKGDRIGSTLRALGDKPFYWKTTDGKGKVLVWTAGRGYSAFHQIPAESLGDKIKEKLVTYLNDLDSKSYPYDIVQLRYTIKSDNGPVDKNLSDFVKTWNSTYVSPKLKIAGVNEMMERFGNKYGKELPVFSGDFTPYWEDGAYSTAHEEGEARMLSDYLLQLQKFSENIQDDNIIQNYFYEARKNIVMFHEHTWGAWNSISSPDDAFAVNQWNYKKAFLDSARNYIKKIEHIVFNQEKLPTKLQVYNSLNYTRSGYIEVKLPDHLTGNVVVDEKGETQFYQTLNNGNICFVAREIPADSFKIYTVSKADPANNVFMPYPEIKIDSVTGAIRSVKYNGNEAVTSGKFSGVNQAVYIPGLDPHIMRNSKVNKIEITENGCIKKTFRVECDIEGSKRVIYKYSIFQGLNVVHLETEIEKKSVREKEAMHIVFPFNITDPVNRIGVSDTFFIPGAGQIPGSNKDYFSVQRWIDVSGADFGVTLSSPQGALFEIGEMVDERPLNKGFRAWKETIEPSSVLFLYVLNNYWNTNFKADQSGVIRFDCFLQFHSKFDFETANKFGKEIHMPLISFWK